MCVILRAQIIELKIKKKALLRDLETKGALEEVALKELEIETQKGFLQQELARYIKLCLNQKLVGFLRTLTNKRQVFYAGDYEPPPVSSLSS